MNTNTRKPTCTDDPVIAELIEHFTPQLEPSEWAAIRPTVIGAISQMPDAAHKTVSARLSTLARYIHWAHHHRGIRLDIDALLQPEHISQWAHTYENGSGRSHRYVLTGIARHVTRTAPIQPNDTIGRSDIANPYSAREVTQLIDFANSHTTDLRRRQANVLITFGLAAGLDGTRHYRTLTAGDVIDNDDHTSIRFADGRVVATHPRWHNALQTIVNGMAANEKVLAIKSISMTVDRLNNIHGAPRTRLNLARLRSTYIVELLDRQLPLPVVLHAAGLATAGRLAEYLKHTTPLTDDQLASALRGDRS